MFYFLLRQPLDQVCGLLEVFWLAGALKIPVNINDQFPFRKTSALYFGRSDFCG